MQLLLCVRLILAKCLTDAVVYAPVNKPLLVFAVESTVMSAKAVTTAYIHELKDESILRFGS